jgi:CxxC motif-containing protein (DUF1111 family)
MFGGAMGGVMSLNAVRASIVVAIVAVGGGASAGTPLDPGPRLGAPFPGGGLGLLDAAHKSYFTAAKPFFQQRYSVSGTIPGAPGVGLGPRFNLDSCAGCHAFPTAGGSSPFVNPQFAMANAAGAPNAIPPFIASNGPVRVARFRKNQDGTLDGTVHQLFTISGRSDAGACVLAQPDFLKELNKTPVNLQARIPTAIYGLGLVEATPDANLLAAAKARATQRALLGISTKYNHDPVDGSIGRFGWKSQHKSLLAFATEALMVEQGVTNEARPTEKLTPGCNLTAQPEDQQPLTPRTGVTSAASAIASAAENMAAFMKMTAAPPRGAITADVTAGQALFSTIGCDACHIPTLTTAPTELTNNKAITYAPYSDFAIHDVGGRLYDGITQGEAVPVAWRTAPLWGLGQRLFFMHDGAATTLDQAIDRHYSTSDTVPTFNSEANKVKLNYDALTDTQKRQIMAFLRSL